MSITCHEFHKALSCVVLENLRVLTRDTCASVKFDHDVSCTICTYVWKGMHCSLYPPPPYKVHPSLMDLVLEFVIVFWRFWILGTVLTGETYTNYSRLFVFLEGQLWLKLGNPRSYGIISQGTYF